MLCDIHTILIYSSIHTSLFSPNIQTRVKWTEVLQAQKNSYHANKTGRKNSYENNNNT